MRRTCRWLILLGLLAAPTSCGSSPIRALTVTQRTVRVGTLDRLVEVVSPSRPDGSLLLVLPGLTESAAQVRSTSGADTLARSAGVTVAYATGYRDSWDAGTCCGSAVVQRVDDVATVRALARAVVAAGGLDPHRVYVAGHSNGAFMTLRLACETHGVYAGFLSVAGSLVAPTCTIPSPPALVLWQGDRDTIVPVGGRDFGGAVLPALGQTLRPFTSGCGAPHTGGTDAVTRSYRWQCAGGTVTLLRSSVGTHAWPGPPGRLLARAWGELAAHRARDGV